MSYVVHPQEDEIFQLVLDRTGLDLGDYSIESIRLAVDGIVQQEDLLGKLRSEDALIQKLVDDALINETIMFRRADFTFIDPWEELYRLVMPALFQEAINGDRNVRVWSPGASEGDELWSIGALLYTQCHTKSDKGVGFSLLGTDIDSSALARAKQTFDGRNFHYSGLVPYYLKEAVNPDGVSIEWNSSVVNSVASYTDIREHNVLAEPAPLSAPFDLIVCRNLMRHLRPTGLAKAIDKIGIALKPGGYLFIDQSDLVALQGNDLVPPWEQVGNSQLIFHKI